MKSLVIFDLDGTLLNTIDDLATAANHAMHTMGYPTHPLTSYNNMVGDGVRKLIERALPEEARTTRIIEAALTHFKKYYNEHLTDLSKPYEGIPELLADLTGRGIDIAVASNKYQEAVTRLIDHFFPGIPFVAVHGNRQGVPVKPDPSVVFAILNESPHPKAEVLYVGDSGVDIDTARRACVDNVGATWGFRSAHELRMHYADALADHPADILDHLGA